MTTRPRSSRASSSRCRGSTSDRSRREGHARHVARALARRDLWPDPGPGPVKKPRASRRRRGCARCAAGRHPHGARSKPGGCRDEGVAGASEAGGAGASAASLSAAADRAFGLHRRCAAGRAVVVADFGDELMISDSTLTETGRWRGWLRFCQHPLAHVFLEPYRLGDADDEGEHRLLVDRYLGTLDVGLGARRRAAPGHSAVGASRADRGPLGRGGRGAVAATVGRAGQAPAGKEPASRGTPSCVPSGSGKRS